MGLNFIHFNRHIAGTMSVFRLYVLPQDKKREDEPVPESSFAFTANASSRDGRGALSSSRHIQRFFMGASRAQRRVAQAAKGMFALAKLRRAELRALRFLAISLFRVAAPSRKWVGDLPVNS